MLLVPADGQNKKLTMDKCTVFVLV